MVEQLATAMGLYWDVYYVDNGYLVGEPAKVAQALQYLRSMGPKRGSCINYSKTFVFGPGAQDFLSQFPVDDPFQDLKILPWGPGAGVDILGTPVHAPHDNSFATQFLGKKVGAQKGMCKILAQVPDAQVQHSILRFCLDTCRINHLLRAMDTVAPSQLAILAQSSCALRDTLDAILGVTMEQYQWAQASLPLSLGGLGVTCPLAVRESTRLSAVLNFMQAGHSVLALPPQLCSPPPPQGLGGSSRASHSPLACIWSPSRA